MTPMDVASSADGGGEEAYSAALEMAEQAVARLEETVARVSATGGGPEHANALVQAGSASVLLGQLELTVPAHDPGRRAAALALRARYDNALLRLGAVPAPAQAAPPAPPAPYNPLASWIQVAPGQWAPLPPGMSPGLPPGYTLPPGYGTAYGVPPQYGMPAPYGAPVGQTVLPGQTMPTGPTGPAVPPAPPAGAAPAQTAMSTPDSPQAHAAAATQTAGHPAAAQAAPPGQPYTQQYGQPFTQAYGQPFAQPFGRPMPPGPAGPMYRMPGYMPQKRESWWRRLRKQIDGLPPEVRKLGGVAMSALIVTGALLVAFSFYASWFGHLTYERNQRIMFDQINDKFKISAAIAAAPQPGDPNLAANPPRGEPIALLEIPKFGTHEAVVQGTGTAELRSAVGHYRPSPMPGQAGNAILAGHRDLYGAPLARIGELERGDKIFVTTQEGKFSYTVETTMRAKTGEQDFLSQATIVNRLTLLTTLDTGGGGRLAVVARLDGQPASLKTLDKNQVKVDELGLGRDPTAWWPSIGWGVVFFGLLTGTFALYRRWRRASTYVLTTPALLAMVLIWFEALARLFPSTF
ncbi:sortase [Sphaerisporangium sp. NPDC051017]|uniref:sortase n=1 Tax=Sphaerisporangium sp. NPDC051017 TaxID=3154636 RepID=UPI00341D8370